MLLQSINDKAKGWVAYLIVGFIAVPFALFGINSYLNGGSGSLTAATVNGEEIPVQQVQGIVLQQRQRLAQMFGGKLPANMNGDFLKQQALDQVVNEVLLRQEAKKNGYRASNQEVFDYISAFPAFQKNGQFDSQTYESLLASQRRSKAEFETQIRDSISNQQFARAITTAAFIPLAQANQYQSLQNQTRDVETFTLKKSDYADQVSVSAEEINKDYESNTKNYMTSEKVKLSYVLLDQDKIAKSLSPDEDALKLVYDDNQSRYVDHEQRKISHILVKIEEDKKDQAQAKAQALYDQIKSGEKTFEDLAVSASDDKLAAEKNGEIGLISPGEMGVQFDTAAFEPTLLKGAMSQVVETEAGFEIIKILDVIPAKTKAFEEVKAEVEKLYRSEEAEKLFLDHTDKLQTNAFENDSSLDQAADAVGLEVLTSDWLEKNSQPNEENPLTSAKVLAAAFSDEVLDVGKNSDLIEIDPKRVVVVRLQEHELPKQKELSAVESQIKDQLSNDKLKALLLEKGTAALASLKQAGAWTTLESIGATAENIKTNTGLKRSDTSLSPSVVSKIFSMQKPEDGSKSFDKAVLPDGDFVLISLSKVSDDKAELDKALKQTFTQSIASREQAAVMQALRETAEIELFPENIQ